jgi:Flp pilus assembly protein TadD
MVLINKALESSPENFSFLNNKGWGLNKLGKFKEARDLLQKSWDLRMQNSIYNHKAFLRLEEAKNEFISL